MVVPTLLSAFLVWVVLVGVGVERDMRVLVLALMLAALVFGLALDYGRRSDFWRSVSRAVVDAADDALHRHGGDHPQTAPHYVEEKGAIL